MNVGLLLVLSLGLASSGGWDCPVEGKGGDPANNLLKNRTVTPGTYEAMPFETLRYLEVPEGVSRKPRAHWPTTALEVLKLQEIRPVAVVGYLLGVKLEGRESTNCEADEREHRDLHVWLSNSPHDDKTEAVVVEITPRLRLQHSGWTTKALTELVKQEAKVRISGWLFLDPEHPDQVGKTRATLWEIHPVTAIEIWTAGAWRSL